MKGFIEVTVLMCFKTYNDLIGSSNFNSKKVCINLDTIHSIFDDNIRLKSDHTLRVKESYEEIKRLIDGASNAENDYIVSPW